MPIQFFKEEIKFEIKDITKLKTWLKNIIKSQNHTLGDLNYIFCNDEYLYNINMEYLQHDTYTDIITFDNAEKETQIAGDIYVSVDRIKENAKNFDKDFQNEFCRVLAHGLWHLLGYGDKSEEEATIMRQKENESIDAFFAMV